MSREEVEAWAELLKNALLAVALLTVVIGGVRQWYVWGWQYRACREELEGWKQVAMSGLKIAERKK